MRHLVPASTLAAAVLLAACTKAPGTGAGTHAPTAHASTTPAMTSDRVPTAVATGVIECIDAAAGTITLAHEPIADLGWPAMTMDFLAAPTLATHARPGDRVRFGFHAKGARYVITRIELAR